MKVEPPSEDLNMYMYQNKKSKFFFNYLFAKPVKMLTAKKNLLNQQSEI